MENYHSILKRALNDIARLKEVQDSGLISGSYLRGKCAAVIGQFMVDVILPMLPKDKRVEFLNDVGYVNQAELARRKGVSKQYISKTVTDSIDKITYNGKVFYYTDLTTQKQ